MNRNTTTILIVILALIALGFIFFKPVSDDRKGDTVNVQVSPETIPNNLNEPQNPQPSTTTTTTSITPPVVTTNVSTQKSFTITGKNYSFTPSKITVKKGDTVKITLVSNDGLHDLRIEEFNAATSKINSGQSETITFVADRMGSFQYYCSVGNHKAMGMLGTLIVTE